jgi:hypothetical protein
MIKEQNEQTRRYGEGSKVIRSEKFRDIVHYG